MTSKRLILVAALLAALAAGCIFTVTEVVTAKLVPDDSGNPVTVANTDFSDAEMEVNLSEDATFNEHKDDIKNIDNIGFYLSVENNLDTAATFQLFLVADTGKNYDSAQALIDALEDPILTGLTIPARKKIVIDWNQSMKYIGDLEPFKAILEKGVFSIYPVAIPRDRFNLTIDSLVVVVTLTGG